MKREGGSEMEALEEAKKRLEEYEEYGCMGPEFFVASQTYALVAIAESLRSISVDLNTIMVDLAKSLRKLD